MTGWDRAILHGEALAKRALERIRAGLTPEDIPHLPGECLAASRLLAVGRREPARSLIRMLSRSAAAAVLPAELGPPVQTVLREFAAWTGDGEFLEKHAGGLGEWRRTVGEEGGAGREPRGEGTSDAMNLITDIVHGVWGLVPSAPDERLGISLSPSMGADEMALTGLRVGGTTLTLRYRRRPERVMMRCEVTRGPRLRVSAALAGSVGEVDVTVDEEVLGGGRAIFEASGEHEVVFGLRE